MGLDNVVGYHLFLFGSIILTCKSIKMRNAIVFFIENKYILNREKYIPRCTDCFIANYLDYIDVKYKQMFVFHDNIVFKKKNQFLLVK